MENLSSRSKAHKFDVIMEDFSFIWLRMNAADFHSINIYAATINLFILVCYPAFWAEKSPIIAAF